MSDKIYIKRSVKEQWKDIIGFKKRYQVSNLGRVKSLARIVYIRNGKTRLKKELMLKIHPDTRGYNSVRISKNCTERTFRVSRLVANAFIPNHYNKPQVNHIDGNKRNDFIENLEWCTASENLSHAYKLKVRTSVGERNGNSKLTKRDVNLIRKTFNRRIYNHRYFMVKHKVSWECIDRIIKNISWKKSH